MDFDANEQRRLEMGVHVKKADGSEYAIVNEAQLEPYGWGSDPLGAVEAWRNEMNYSDNVTMKVTTDEESGLPTLEYTLRADMTTSATRPEVALRRFGQYLISLANRTPADESQFSGAGLQLLQQG